MKKLLVSLLCVVMMVTFMPSMAFADGDPEATIQKSAGEIVSYDTLEAAVEAAVDGDTIILNQSAECNGGITFDQSGDIVLDLNGNFISSNGYDIVLIKADDLNLEIKNGDLIGTGRETYGIYSYAKSTQDDSGYNNLNLTLKNVNINTTDQSVGVQGLNKNQNVTIDNCTIQSGTLAVYHPPISGTLKIKDTGIEASTGVMVKGGNVIIEGNTSIHATGDKKVSDKPYDGSQGGLEAPGDAVYLEGGYNRDIDVQILGGTFKSDNAFPVQKRFAEQPADPALVRNVEITGGKFDVKNKDEISQIMDHLKIDNTATVNLASPLSISDELTLDKNVTITAEKDVNITLASNNAVIDIKADVAFKGFDVSTAIVNAGGVLGKVLVNEGKTLTISDNTGNGMNGGILEVNGGKVVANNNGSNGITAKVVAAGDAVINATGNGKNGLTLNGGSNIAGTAKVTATDNNSANKGGHDVEINTNGTVEGLEEITIEGNASVTVGTMAGHSISDAVSDRDKVVIVKGEGVKIDVLNPVTDDSHPENSTDALFQKAKNLDQNGAPVVGTEKENTAEQGVVILGNKATVHGAVTEVKLDRPVELTVANGAEVGKINAPAGTIVTNESEEPVTVVTPSGEITLDKGESVTSKPSTGGGGGIIIPPAVQKPTIEVDEHAKVLLSSDGTTATITVDEGYELADVVLNGVSQGKVTFVYGLKTGDVLKVTTVAKGETEAEKNARLKAGVENTTIKLKSTLGKGHVRLDWNKSEGYKVDNYQVFRSTKRYSGYGTKAYFTTKQGGLRAWYKNTKQLKKGTRYYYKVRGVREIAGETVYTQWSNKAWRLVK